MKKTLLFLISAILVASCADKNSYTIDGTIQGGEFDNRKVYLQVPNENMRELISIDSATIANGRFHFKGMADSMKMGFLNYGEEGRPASFVLEPGKITISIDSLMALTIGGTKKNKEYQQFNDDIQSMISEFDKKHRDNADNLSDAEKAEFEKYRDEFIDQFSNKIVSFLKPNLQNPLGEYEFMMRSYYLKPEQVIELLEVASPAFKSTEIVQGMTKRAEAMLATSEGKPFADLSGKTLDGKDARLSDYAGKGKVVLIDFWASWCGPCIRSLPNLIEVYGKYKDKGFEIVGVSLDGEKGAWADATRKHGVVWPQFSNLKGWEDESARVYGVTGIPHTVLISKDGIIAAKDLHGEQLTAKIEELLK